MPDPKNDKKLVMCPDPDCKKESPADAEECIGCGLPLADFFAFDRFMTIREKIAKQPANKPATKRQSFFGRR